MPLNVDSLEKVASEIPIAAKKLACFNPATGELLHEFVCSGEAEVREAVARSRVWQLPWYELSVQKRIGILRKFQNLLHKNKSEIAQAITRESGKPYVEALTTEVLVVLDATQFLIENAHRLLREESVPHANLAMQTKAGRILRQPYGVVGIISPWNYPFSIPGTESLAALVAGNAVVLKPSEFTSMSALHLGSLLYEAGVPKNVFQVLPGDSGSGAALIGSGIDKLVFTGSVPTGKRIAQLAAARFLPVVLELGGKDAMLVLDDADLEVASSGAIWGAFVNAGQACLSVERCYVHRSIYESFLKLCAGKATQLRVGNGLNPEVEIGPLIHGRHLQVVEAHVEDARSRGARVVAGGKRLTELGENFYAPTVLADVLQEMRIMREETFGPVLPLMAFDTEEEAIKLANDSEYGLAASVWTCNRERGEAIARRIQAGTVMINDVVSCFGISEAPHGGVKASGIGRTHGKFGLDEMVRIKYLDSDCLTGVKKVWWYKYGEAFSRQMESFLDLQFAPQLTRKLRGALGSAGVYIRRRL